MKAEEILKGLSLHLVLCNIIPGLPGKPKIIVPKNAFNLGEIVDLECAFANSGDPPVTHYKWLDAKDGAVLFESNGPLFRVKAKVNASYICIGSTGHYETQQSDIMQLVIECEYKLLFAFLDD